MSFRGGRFWGGVGLAILGLVLYIAWTLAWFPVLILDLPTGLTVAWLLAVLCAFLGIHVFQKRLGGLLRAALRLGRPRIRPTRLLAFLAVLLASDTVLGVLYGIWVEIPPDLNEELDLLTSKPYGWLAVVLLAVVLAPLIEEFTFRGWIQGSLEPRWGLGPALLVSAALFAAAHVEVTLFPYYFLGGLLLGAAVRVTESIWTGVLMHTVMNATTLLLDETGAGMEIESWLGSWGATPLTALYAVLLLLLLLSLRAGRHVRQDLVHPP